MQGHVLPLRVYLSVFAALLVLTGVTTGVAFVDLGVLNDLVALTIACAKALIVVLWFMHLRHERLALGLTVAISIVALTLILFGLTVPDGMAA